MHAATTTPRSFDVHAERSGRVVLASRGDVVAVLTGYEGPPLPARLNGARLEPVGPRAWRLSSAEGEFNFSARGVERLEPQPRLFEELLAPFALRPRDRALVGVLLKLLRLPGGAWALRQWHSRRR